MSFQHLLYKEPDKTMAEKTLLERWLGIWGNMAVCNNRTGSADSDVKWH